MTLSSPLWAAVAALAIGTAALWTNPRRRMNRVLTYVSAYVTFWLVLRHVIVVFPGDLRWMRVAWIASGLFPVGIWLVRDTILRPHVRLIARLGAVRFWWLFPAATSGVALSSWAFTNDGFGSVVYGPGYYTMLFGAIGAQLLLAGTTFRKLRGQIGARRLEMQLLILGGVTAVCFAHGLLGLSVYLGDASLGRTMPLVFVALFGGMVWSLLTTRLLDARHIVTIVVEKAVLVAGVTVFVWGIQQLSLQFFAEWLSYGLSIALGLWFATEVRPWLQEVSQRKTAGEKVRRDAYEIGRRDLPPEAMEAEFVRLLTSWADCERAVILMASQGRLVGGGIEWPLDQPEFKLLHSLRWVTPERLDRGRPRPHGQALKNRLSEGRFGAIVVSGGPSLAFVIALSVPRSCQPYSFPRILKLIALETIIESSLSRAHYVAKVQHAEKLATVGVLGASIAHEIRNPLVSIKTFVQLLPGHYQEQAFRDKFFRLIGDEVGRIDRLTEQLMDLSAPRVLVPKDTDLHELLAASLDLISSKAEDRSVALIRDFEPQLSSVFVDPSAVKQVVMNLAFNAIQAQEHQPSDRWVKFSTRQNANGVELAISDNGPGIAGEVWERLFQPFQTTKSSGFGLGLAICKDILSSLHASITADPPASGCGATFRIILPCQPPTT
ncbi:hypothetical protein DB347_08460 [Opitutaceae bacterium EW11]|nr:hypothetical protein DB347_08460 [Opitutaceae bacterium EW11]